MKRMDDKKNCKILCLVLLLGIFVYGCAFGFLNKEAENMLQEVSKKLTEVGKTMSINDIKEVRIENTAGIDAVVLCQAYIPTVELEKGLRTLHIPPATFETIQTIASVQDGIYLFLLKKGKIVAKGRLGIEVNLVELVLGVPVQGSLLLEIVRFDREWRYLEIRKIK